jgi:hypothetical protein
MKGFLRILVTAVVLVVGQARAAEKPVTFDTKTADFAIAFNGETSAYRDMSTFVLPGTPLTVEVIGGPPGEYTLKTDQGAYAARGARAWRWEAPAEYGHYALTIAPPGGKADITLHVFVMVPYHDMKDGYINGYRIGGYPATPLKGNPMYVPPPGFIEVTKKNRDTKISPHFTLKQFLCKEDTSKQYPKYVVLKERLPLKLEAVLERVNELGFKVDTLHVMSAYRTPYYNHAIGDVRYSLHQFGSAADIYIDPLKKDRMADLNHDNQVDIQDSKLLYDVIERMLETKELGRFQGGMGF